MRCTGLLTSEEDGCMMSGTEDGFLVSRYNTEELRISKIGALFLTCPSPRAVWLFFSPFPLQFMFKLKLEACRAERERILAVG